MSWGHRPRALISLATQVCLDTIDCLVIRISLSEAMLVASLPPLILVKVYHPGHVPWFFLQKNFGIFHISFQSLLTLQHLLEEKRLNNIFSSTYADMNMHMQLQYNRIHQWFVGILLISLSIHIKLILSVMHARTHPHMLIHVASVAYHETITVEV